MRALYTLIVEISRIVLPIVGLFNSSIKQFLHQRKSTFQDIAEWKSRQSTKPVLWLHCASLGEYEMIVPLISEEEIKNKFQIVVSFFSASGYNHAKLDGLVDAKFYLPLDRKSEMNRLVKTVNPSVFVLVKYDFWLNLLSSLNNHSCTKILVNGLFRKGQFISTPLASAWRNQLKKFTRIYVQNDSSKNMLDSFKFENVELSKDLRYDRVVQIKSKNLTVLRIKEFTDNQPTLILGSSWPEEEYIVLQWFVFWQKESLNSDIKVIIAPHDVSQAHIERLQQDYKKFNPVLFTDSADVTKSQILILNTIGHLSSAYQYATMAFVGGAFGRGLHNILEAAVFGLPIFTGTNIDKFPEAIALQKLGVLHALDQDPRHFIELIGDYIEKDNRLAQTDQILSEWFEEQTGETRKIMEFVLTASNKT